MKLFSTLFCRPKYYSNNQKLPVFDIMAICNRLIEVIFTARNQVVPQYSPEYIGTNTPQQYKKSRMSNFSQPNLSNTSPLMVPLRKALLFALLPLFLLLSGQVFAQNDLALTKTASKSTAIIGDVVTFTVTVKNEGGTAVTGVKVKDLLPAGMTLQGAATPSAGTYDPVTGIWDIGAIAAATPTVTLTMNAKITAEGANLNQAEITAMTEPDVDSSPGNASYLEDDFASACVSVPVVLYNTQTLTASALSGLAGYKWFKDGVEIVGQTSSTYNVTTAGSYTYTANVGAAACPASLCCPLIVNYKGYASLGNLVWNDKNRDGIQDAGEAGVAGVIVELYTAAGALVKKDTTDGTGGYLFDKLIPGDYYVKFVTSSFPANAGFVISPKDAGGNTVTSDTKDSDADPATGQTATITLVDGQNDPNWDLGINQAAASLGDYVWYDINKNGIQDVGEAGVAGVIVELYNSTTGALVKKDTTDAAGLYGFTNLVPGDYYVQFVKSSLAPGYLISPKDAGTDDAKDSDADPVTGKTATTTLIAGENDPTWDLGINKPSASLGDFVWNDTNKDGKQDASELGIPNVIVEVHKLDGTLVAKDTTDATGKYLFPDLLPGSYYVQFVTSTLPPGFVASPKDAGTDDLKDSDAGTDGKTGTIVLADGDKNVSVDYGVNPSLASLGDFVWYDTNKNGIQDAGEKGVIGVIVELYNSTTGALVKKDTTDAAGLYGFTNLIPGDYYVQFVTSTLPVNYVISPKDAGTDDAKDSDADATGKTATTTLIAGENDLTWDLGINKPSASLGDFVWNDTNKDGKQDASELGIPNVIVEVRKLDGTLVAKDTTDATGKYLFPDLLPGSYYVQFVTSTLPAGFVASPKDAGTDDLKDSDAGTDGKTGTIVLADGDKNVSVDYGVNQPLASLGDYVWNDTNKDGIQDVTETGVANVIVELHKADGTLVSKDTTDAAGKYLFTNLPLGDYYVQFVTTSLPVGYVVSPKDAGTDDAKDSDADATGKTAITTLTAGENDVTWDLGINKPVGSVGDFVWNDTNRDGIQDPSEVGVPGVTVELRKADGTLVASVVTDATGKYNFPNVPPGTYYVDVLIPSGFVASPQTAGTDPYQYTSHSSSKFGR
jgi:large repetitive protein